MDRQIVLWGIQNHEDTHRKVDFWRRELSTARQINTENVEDNTLTWDYILMEEVYEALEQASLGNDEKLEEELLQAAAVIFSWAEAIRRRKK
jgi:hypothetical protein